MRQNFEIGNVSGGVWGGVIYGSGEGGQLGVLTQ